LAKEPTEIPPPYVLAGTIAIKLTGLRRML
jgi:hypothetical protein